VFVSSASEASQAEPGHFRHRARPLTRSIGGWLFIVLAILLDASGASAQSAPDAPANLVAVAGSARVTLTWSAVAGATGYRVFRTTTGTFSSTPLTTVTTTSYTNTGLANGTAYSYRLAAQNSVGDGPFSATVSATPVAVPTAPSTISAVGGDRQATVSWSAVAVATSYRVYRSLISGTYSSTPTATVPAGSTTFVDTGLENGPQYFYTIIAANGSGSSARSAQASALTEAPLLVVDAQTTAAFRLLRQATFGPRPGDVDRVKLIGHGAFLDEQFAAPVSQYPDVLFTQTIEDAQQHFVRLALTAPDQLRQRVAWALHKIWVVSAADPGATPGIVAHQRLFVQHAFGNYRDLMRAVTLNPAMGRYLTMLNNRSQSVSGVPPNENYSREVMQLFTLGTTTLAPDGTPVIGPGGTPTASYTENDVTALARILTGWTYGDGDPSTLPPGLAAVNYNVPMEPVAAFHDRGAKTFLGTAFPEDASAVEDLDHALDVMFNHPNVGPFVAGQLIKQLVTSNPSPAYVRDVAAAFADNGAGVRGDLAAVVRAMLVHPEASATGPNVGKLAEPVLFLVSLMRSLNAITPDLRLLVDRMTAMGQRVFYPPSVFSYFSPVYSVRGTSGPGGVPLSGPEFQILTSLTIVERTNFIAQVLAGVFLDSIIFDPTPYVGRARDAAALVDHCNLQFMGGRMTSQQRTEIVAAVRALSIISITERARTALYLTLVIAHSQVDR
jgi:uncharacterized protein (DUF1800 family)